MIRTVKWWLQGVIGPFIPPSKTLAHWTKCHCHRNQVTAKIGFYGQLSFPTTKHQPIGQNLIKVPSHSTLEQQLMQILPRIHHIRRSSDVHHFIQNWTDPTQDLSLQRLNPSSRFAYWEVLNRSDGSYLGSITSPKIESILPTFARWKRIEIRIFKDRTQTPTLRIEQTKIEDLSYPLFSPKHQSKWWMLGKILHSLSWVPIWTCPPTLCIANFAKIWNFSNINRSDGS